VKNNDLELFHVRSASAARNVTRCTLNTQRLYLKNR